VWLKVAKAYFGPINIRTKSETNWPTRRPLQLIAIVSINNNNVKVT